MSKTYAAIYVPQETNDEQQEDKQKRVFKEKMKDYFLSYTKKIRNNAGNVDTDMIVEYMSRENVTKFTQKYATAAIAEIMSGTPITSPKMLDTLFNTYAPALNAGLAQTGYNSLLELRNAVKAGTVNIPNFVQGLSDGLSIIYGDNVNYSKYGEEIPIDIVTKYDINYSIMTAKNTIDTNLSDKNTGSNITSASTTDSNTGKMSFLDYAKGLDTVQITLDGVIKNEQAETWKISDISQQIADLMVAPTVVNIRIGKSIFENCIITTYKPTITNIYELSFNMTFRYKYLQNLRAMCGKNAVYNISADRFLRNMAAPETYGGIVYGVKK